MDLDNIEVSHSQRRMSTISQLCTNAESIEDVWTDSSISGAVQWPERLFLAYRSTQDKVARCNLCNFAPTQCARQSRKTKSLFGDCWLPRDCCYLLARIAVCHRDMRHTFLITTSSGLSWRELSDRCYSRPSCDHFFIDFWHGAAYQADMVLHTGSKRRSIFEDLRRCRNPDYMASTRWAWHGNATPSHPL